MRRWWRRQHWYVIKRHIGAPDGEILDDDLDAILDDDGEYILED